MMIVSVGVSSEPVCLLPDVGRQRRQRVRDLFRDKLPHVALDSNNNTHTEKQNIRIDDIVSL